ncbi:MAG: hypothetical protein HFI67_11370 [Lachnospiraceae bacterium]|nr:hypothetical protein [Lachnospiraceae bacterium]
MAEMQIHSHVTELPQSCKSAAERMAAELEEEDRYVNLSGDCLKKLTKLEQKIGKETGEKVALVAYRL